MEHQDRPVQNVRPLLRRANLAVTRLRLQLGALMFANGNRHLTAEMLYAEAKEAQIETSLASVYNTLNQFTGAGLLHKVKVSGSKAYFDTNTACHHHFYFEGEERLIDIPHDDAILRVMPNIPSVYEISYVEVAVRLRAKKQ